MHNAFLFKRETMSRDRHKSIKLLCPNLFLRAVLAERSFRKTRTFRKLPSVSVDECVYWEPAWWEVYRLLDLELPFQLYFLLDKASSVSSSVKWSSYSMVVRIGWDNNVTVERNSGTGTKRSLLNQKNSKPKKVTLLLFLLFTNYVIPLAVTRQIWKLPCYSNYVLTWL